MTRHKTVYDAATFAAKMQKMHPSDHFKICSPYKGLKKTLVIEHVSEKAPIHLFAMKAEYLVNGKWCPICEERKNSTSSLMDLEFKERLSKKYGDEYTCVGHYEKMRSKVRIRHNCKECGNYEWDVYPWNILSGHGCPKCAGRTFPTKDEFIEMIGPEFQLKGDYQGYKADVFLVHTSPSHEEFCFYTTPKEFISAPKCPECERIEAEKAFYKKVEELTGGEYTVLGKYYGNLIKIKMRHNCPRCGYHTWEVRPNNFLNGSRCPNCSKYIAAKERKRRPAAASS